MMPELTPALAALFDTAQWAWCAPIVRYATPPSALEFHRMHVAKNAPCVISGLAKGWTEVESLHAFFTGPLGGYDRTVVVNASPNGRGDAVAHSPEFGKVFVKPMEREMRLAEFDAFLRPDGPNRLVKSRLPPGSVLYLSAQNDCLRTSFGALIEQGYCPASLPLGDEAFGAPADAVNLWVGDARAVTTAHRDSSYENLYVVLAGQKVFDLMPPCVAPMLGERAFPTCEYCLDGNGRWTLRPEADAADTAWVELDPADPAAAARVHAPFALVPDGLRMRVEVRAGDCLYLPAGWWRVTQSEPTVAVNYWYDRAFDALWALETCVEELVGTMR